MRLIILLINHFDAHVKKAFLQFRLVYLINIIDCKNYLPHHSLCKGFLQYEVFHKVEDGKITYKIFHKLQI